MLMKNRGKVFKVLSYQSRSTKGFYKRIYNMCIQRRYLSMALMIFAIMILDAMINRVNARDFGQRYGLESVTIEGGPIATKHFQSDDENFRERHALAIAKVSTKNYGNWGVYFLNPNSVDRTSVGFGYVTDPLSIPLIASTELELSAALGLVTGYQDYPVPLLAGHARLKLYESHNNKWNAGVATAILPYYAEDQTTKDNSFGAVVSMPFLSVQYKF